MYHAVLLAITLTLHCEDLTSRRSLCMVWHCGYYSKLLCLQESAYSRRVFVGYHLCDGKSCFLDFCKDFFEHIRFRSPRCAFPVLAHASLSEIGNWSCRVVMPSSRRVV